MCSDYEREFREYTREVHHFEEVSRSNYKAVSGGEVVCWGALEGRRDEIEGKWRNAQKSGDRMTRGMKGRICNVLS